MAKGSCAEVRSMLHIIIDENMISQEKYDVLSTEVQKLSVMLQKFINTFQ
ncbi:MAG: four helix bundle protein [Candidatus Peribacteria bacterium]|nr:MAG: four helix bundle protein [Candidatus Peribacteria bacterium]